MKTLTFKEVAHHYIGCQFQIIATGKKAVFDFYYLGNTEPVGTHDYCQADYAFNEIKPILRSLSDWGLDEQQEYQDIFATHIPTLGGDQILYAKFTHLLISKGFDLFNLIESGEAIDKSTIK